MSKFHDEIQSKLDNNEWNITIAHNVLKREKREKKNKKIILSLIACFLFVFTLNITYKDTNKVFWEDEVISVFFETSEVYVFSSGIDEFIIEMF